MMRLRILCAALLVAAIGAGASLAASGTTLRRSKTFMLRAGSTKTFLLAYPDALKFAGASYRGSVRVLGPSPSASGSAPSLLKVRVLFHGSALGGSDYSAKVQNANPAGTAPVRVALTATTVLPRQGQGQGQG
jgi:hypothetical protein